MLEQDELMVTMYARVNTHTDKGEDMGMSVFMSVCCIKCQQSLAAPLLSGMTTCVMLPLHISYPELESAVFSRSPSSFYWERVVRDNNLDALEVLTATRLVIVSRPFQWAKPEVFVCIQYIQLYARIKTKYIMRPY